MNLLSPAVSHKNFEVGVHFLHVYMGMGMGKVEIAHPKMGALAPMIALFSAHSVIRVLVSSLRLDCFLMNLPSD